MYCPICGEENKGDNPFCGSCGENLEDEMKYLKGSIKIGGIGTLLLILSFVLYFLYFMMVSELMLLVSAFLIMIVGVFLLSRSDKLSAGSAVKHERFCPSCKNIEFNQKFCVYCGNNLEDVMGYFKLDKYYIEVNKNFLKVWGRIRRGDQNRTEPCIFYVDKIQNLQVTECKGTVFTSPCIKFDYEGDCNLKGTFSIRKEGSVKVPIDKKWLGKIDQLFSSGLYSEARTDL